jgi:hypothetical protein
LFCFRRCPDRPRDPRRRPAAGRAELGNALAPACGYTDLLPAVGPQQAAAYAERIGRSLDHAAEILTRLAGIVRFEEAEFGGVAMLDLDAAADGRHGTADLERTGD